MNFKIKLKVPVNLQSFRVKSVLGTYNMTEDHASVEIAGEIAIEGQEWNVGLIVGASGSGKSQIAKHCFGDDLIESYEYKAASVLDDMPKGLKTAEITRAFTSVGFGSPPSWLKPYGVLSNGEKMRTDLARAILEKRELIVFDEFTSVVDRPVAKAGSFAIQKAIRRDKRKFIAVSCHRDVVEWLRPDWIFDTDQMQFFFAQSHKSGLSSNLTSTQYLELKSQLSGNYFESITT